MESNAVPQPPSQLTSNPNLLHLPTPTENTSLLTKLSEASGMTQKRKLFKDSSPTERRELYLHSAFNLETGTIKFEGSMYIISQLIPEEYLPELTINLPPTRVLRYLLTERNFSALRNLLEKGQLTLTEECILHLNGSYACAHFDLATEFNPDLVFSLLKSGKLPFSDTILSKLNRQKYLEDLLSLTIDTRDFDKFRLVAKRLIQPISSSLVDKLPDYWQLVLSRLGKLQQTSTTSSTSSTSSVASLFCNSCGNSITQQPQPSTSKNLTTPPTTKPNQPQPSSPSLCLSCQATFEVDLSVMSDLDSHVLENGMIYKVDISYTPKENTYEVLTLLGNKKLVFDLIYISGINELPEVNKYLQLNNTNSPNSLQLNKQGGEKICGT